MKRALSVLPVLVMVALLAGCGSSGHGAAPFVPATGTLPPSTAAPSTTVGQAPSVTTTTIDTAQIPTSITAAYVDAVLKVLEHVQGNGTRAAVRVHNLAPAAIRDFAAVYAPGLRNSQLLALITAIDKQYSGFRQPPGDLVVTVRRLITAQPTCIYARVHTDDSALTAIKPSPINAEFLELRRAPNRRFVKLNPTGWVISFDRVTVTSAPIPDQCAG